MERGPNPAAAQRAQFSLRTFLVAVLVLGAALGLLGRLLRVDPGMFAFVLVAISTVGPFLLAIATLLWLGWRRWPAWSVPVCAACRHDLRWTRPHQFGKCPQCEADLTAPGALRFVSGSAGSRRLVAWGVFLALAPVAGLGISAALRTLAGPSPGGLGLLSNSQLIEQRLPAQVDQPWVWRELERRLMAGKLSQQEVDGAVKILVGHMKATRPGGWDQPFHWQDDFLRKAANSGAVSEPVLLELCDAFFGTQPQIRPLPRVREGGDGFGIEVEYGSHWENHFGPAIRLLWEVAEIRIDGKPANVRQTSKTSYEWSGYVDGPLAAGARKLIVELECAYADEDDLAGLNVNHLPAAKWPKARKRWKQTISAGLNVYTKDEPLLKLVSDAKLSPAGSGEIQVNRLLIQPDRDGSSRLILNLHIADSPAVPLSFDVAARLGDRTVPLGSLLAVREGNWGMQSGEQLERRIEAVDPSIRSADILLTPNPKHIEHQPRVEEIWGEAITFSQVPIERLDVETAEPGKPP